MIIQNTFLLTCSTLITAILGLLNSVLIARYLSVSDLGLFSLTLRSIIILVTFVLPGLSPTVSRFFCEYRKESIDKAKRIFSTGFFLICAFSVIVFIFVNLLSGLIAGKFYKKPEILPFWGLFSFMIIIQPLVTFLDETIKVQERFKIISLAKVLHPLFYLILLSIVISLDMGLKGVIAAYIISFISILMLYLLTSLKLIGFYKPAINKGLIQFWMPLGASQLVKGFLGMSPVLIIGRYLPTTSIGYYEIIDRTLRMIILPAEQYREVVNMRLMNIFFEAKEKFSKLLNESIKTHGAYVLLSICFAYFIAKVAFQLLYGNNYLPAVPAFRLFLIYGVFVTLPLFQRPVYYVHNKSSYYLYYSVIIGLINIILLYVFVKLYGLLGVAYALILTCIVALSLAVYLSNRLGSQIHSRNIIVPMFVAIPLTVITYFTIYKINAWFAATLFSVCYIFALKTIGYLMLPPIKTLINEITLGRKQK